MKARGSINLRGRVYKMLEQHDQKPLWIISKVKVLPAELCRLFFCGAMTVCQDPISPQN